MKQGEYLKAALKSVRAEVVKEVRGRGLMIAIELDREAGGVRRYCEALAKRGVLATDAHDHIIRITSPLVIKREEADWAIERIAAVLTGHAL
jgi:ornithine--oxo-acid transaminase